MGIGPRPLSRQEQDRRDRRVELRKLRSEIEALPEPHRSFLTEQLKLADAWSELAGGSADGIWHPSPPPGPGPVDLTSDKIVEET